MEVKVRTINPKMLAACAVLLLPLVAAPAQQLATSHAVSPKAASAAAVVPTIDRKPVARVNDTVLTEHDLLREMYTIFPYANIHNGVPKAMEPEMRRGALDMIVFEELLYQEALRRKVTVSPERMKRALVAFRKQFPTQQEYDRVLQVEVNGSTQMMRQKIRRSLLIESMLKTEVGEKAKVSLVEARAFYDKNPKVFQHPETFSIQTISILPPPNGNPDVQKEARRHAEDALRQAKATKTYQEFGVLAEKISDDDWHVNMGDRKAVRRDALPPELVKAALAMKPGQVSDLIQLGTAYTLFRLNAHTPAGKASFAEVKEKLRKDLAKAKYEKLRSLLAKKLRETSKVEEL